MFILPEFLKLEKGTLLRFHVPWILASVLLLHLLFFIPTMFWERESAQIHQQFREAWEATYKHERAAQGIEPTEQLFQKELQEKLHLYTSYKPPYWFNLIPDRFYFTNLLTNWILTPSSLASGWFALLLLFLFYPYPGYWLEERWGLGKVLLWIFGSGTVASVLYLILTKIIGRLGDMSYTSMTAVLTASMAAMLALHKEGMPLRIRNAGSWTTIPIPVPVWFALWMAADAVLNLFVSPANFQRAFLVDIMVGIIAYAAAPAIPYRVKKIQEIRREAAEHAHKVDPVVAARKRAHGQITEAWLLFEGLDFDGAQQKFADAMNWLFQNSGTEKDLIDQTFARMLAEKLQMRFASDTWFGWGQQLATIGLTRHSVQCCENALRNEPSAIVARAALVLAAEGRIALDMDKLRAAKYLQKVYQLQPEDPLGRKASEILTTLLPSITPAVAPTPPPKPQEPEGIPLRPTTVTPATAEEPIRIQKANESKPAQNPGLSQSPFSKSPFSKN